MRKDYKNREISDFLNNIELPDVQTPLHKQRLKKALLSSEHLYRNPATSPLQIFSPCSSLFLRKYGGYSMAAIAIFLTIAVLSFMPFTAPAFAHIVLDVNPTVRLTIDSRNNVIAFETLDQTAFEIFDEMDFRGKSTENAIEEIVGRLHERITFEQDNHVVLLVYPAQNKKIDDVAKTLTKAESTVNRRLTELKAQAQVKSFALQAEVFTAAEQAGLMPSQYARLLEYGMNSNNLTQLFHQGDDPEVDREYFVGHFGEIAEQVTKVLAKDVPENEAVLVVREVLVARRGTGELRRVVQRLNEFLDEDLTPREAIARVRRDIRSRRNLKGIDERDSEDKGKNEYAPDDEGARQGNAYGQDDEDTDQNNKHLLDDRIDSQDDEQRRPDANENRRNLRERQNERQQRREERQEQQNEKQEQPDEEQKRQDSGNDEQTLPDEGLEQDVDRQNRLNEKQEQRNERQQRRNERREQQNERQQPRNERQGQHDASPPLSDVENSSSDETDAEINQEE